MNLTVHLPDDLAAQLATHGRDLAQRALEAFGCDEYRAGRLTRPELQRMLGLETRFDLDGILKAHDIYDGITSEELQLQLETLDRLGI
jgi:hypothetical protein